MKAIIENKYYITIIFFFSVLISYYCFPAEDAAILYAYSENLADTGVISYFPGGEPAEGATDFLWMILLSIFYFFGLNTYFSAIFINLCSLIIITKTIQDHFKLSNADGLVIFLFHLSLTHTYAALAGFSALFVEMLLVLVITNYLKNNTSKTIFFSFIGCLTRPDFVLFILAINFSLLIKNFNIRIIKKYSLYTCLGIIYFIARYKYFGELFPLPFYAKNTWDFLNNIEWGRQLLILSPCIVIFCFIKIKENINQFFFVLLLTIVIPTLYYTNQTLYQNIGQRFYFYIPIIALIIILNLNFNINETNKRKLINFLILSIGITSFLHQSLDRSLGPLILNTKKNNFYLLTQDLKKINNEKNIKVATTEAGLIPYISKANTIDLFGLNTKKLAKKPADKKYMEENYFDVIFVNSSIVGKTCKNFKDNFLKSKSLTKTQGDRKDNWTEFNYKILAGINENEHEFFILKYPTLAAINKKSKSYQNLKKSLIQRGGKYCN